MDIFLSYCVSTKCVTPWDNRNGWLGVKHRITYLLTPSGPVSLPAFHLAPEMQASWSPMLPTDLLLPQSLVLVSILVECSWMWILLELPPTSQSGSKKEPITLRSGASRNGLLQPALSPWNPVVGGNIVGLAQLVALYNSLARPVSPLHNLARI